MFHKSHENCTNNPLLQYICNFYRKILTYIWIFTFLCFVTKTYLKSINIRWKITRRKDRKPQLILTVGWHLILNKLISNLNSIYRQRYTLTKIFSCLQKIYLHLWIKSCWSLTTHTVLLKAHAKQETANDLKCKAS